MAKLCNGIRVFCAQPEGTGRISSSLSLLAAYGGLLRRAAHASCWMKSVAVAGALIYIDNFSLRYTGRGTT
jgi:hypothetical protein